LIRVVALRKAAVAGIAGALAWEAALRSAILAGVPTFDIVRELGTVVFPQGPAVAMWAAGVGAHALVGICWAVTYAYFGWGRLRFPPAVQGLVLSAVPAVLALFIVFPQLQLIGLASNEVQLTAAMLMPHLTGSQLAGLITGHAIFGLVVGAIYTHPVGYRADRPPDIRLPMRRKCADPESRRRTDHGFIFATGIECSYPTIEHGRWRRDEMHEARHYAFWQRDFELAREIGATHLRYGPPLHLVYAAPGSFRWELVDEPMAELEAHGPEPIVDLCHFGLPCWLGDFQNPDIAPALAEYAAAFAHRYPWVRFYTPINEMYVCARMSALDGLWNEQRCDVRSYLTAVFNLAGANVAMSDAILGVCPDAIFINSESSEFYQPCCPDEAIVERAELENQRRFLPLDLLFAHEVSEPMLAILREHGHDDDYRRFLARTVPRRSVLGVDYYEWNEKLVDRDAAPRALGELFGWSVIASQYWERYRRTMMHTETNRVDARDAPQWLWRQWHNVQLLRKAGVPLIGFTWYSLTDQLDWGTAIRSPVGRIDPSGLFDLNRDARPVGLSYKHLIDMHRDAEEYRNCAALRELMD
jgi:beta-glucosidase/6-phospho-beta-glucosidase/beta-galactosidase